MGRKKEEIIIEESAYVKHSKQRTMRLSIAEGASWSLAKGFSGSFTTPFALAIGANSFQIGALSAISGLMAPLGKWKGSRLMEKHSRKSILVRSKLIHAILWAMIIGLAYLSWMGIGEVYLPYALILIWGVGIHYVWGVGDVAWFSWMGDLVPARIRGRYFSRRNRITGFVGLFAFVLAAFVLDFYKTRGLVLFGFGIIIGISLVFRLVSRDLTQRQFNPQFRVKKGHYFTFRSFLGNYDNYTKFAFFQAFFYLSIMVSTPFFAVYMLEYLNFSYVTFTAVTLSSTVFYLIFLPLAGKFSDRYGNLKLLYIAGFLFPIVPLLWIFLKSPIYLILLPGLIAGAANSAYLLGIANFTYEITGPQKRGLYVAYTSILVGVGTFVGGLIGGLFVQYVPITFMQPILFVFLLSAILMVMTGLFFLPQIKEIVKHEKMKGFSLDFSHPFKTIDSDVIWFKNFIHEN